jgi:hypothetical protein
MRASEAFTTARRPAPATITLPASAFADDWSDRPTVDVEVGIRRIAVKDIVEARSAASADAVRQHPRPGDPAGVDAFYDALMMWVVSRCTCEPDDVAAEWSMWGGLPQDNAPLALTGEGARAIFDAHERLTIEQDPSTMEATDDDIVRLPDVYAAAVAHVEGSRGARVRRLLRFCLDELEDMTPVSDG